MKSTTIYVYHSMRFDGNIYVKVAGLSSEKQCEITLYKEGVIVSSFNGKMAVFGEQTSGLYQAIAILKDLEGNTTTLQSRHVNVVGSVTYHTEPSASTTKFTKENYRRYEGVNSYYLQVKLDGEDGIERLKHERATHLPHFSRIQNNANYEAAGNSKLLGNILPNTYSIDPNCQFDELVAIANELEKLDYVIYCSVVPDTSNMAAPELLPYEEGVKMCGTAEDEFSLSHMTTVTPDFSARQTYLQPTSTNIKGMNVLAAWGRGETGNAATVRHLDFGVYRNHEDLKDNITVVNSRSEISDCNHGTASTGCIAAKKNYFGVTGIAHNCDFNFYDTGDLNLIIRDAMPGDIVSLDIQLSYNGKLLPTIDSRSWWDRINGLTQKGVVVILSAGNGGLDLSPAAGNMNQFGDSGSMLIGACDHRNGKRVSFSNYNHPTSLINSWGDWSVTTTGYGDLQNAPENERKYTGSYSGTSSSTPLCAGALALIQSYAIAEYGIYLNSYEMRQLIIENGDTEGVAGKIGYRPNVDSAMTAFRQRFAPAAPGGLHSTEQTRSRIVMQWNPVNGVHPVAYYTLYRDGNMVGQTVGTTLEDCGLTAATCYHYQVTATDSHGATSSFSDPVDVITSKDIRARYVLIRRTPANNVNTYMGFTELEVFSEGVNRALGAPVYSSTGTWYSGQGGENLVDGNKFRVPASTSGYVSGDCWFLADLGAEYEVDKIMLYGRSNSPDAPNRERDMAIFALPATALPAGSATTAAAMPGYDALRSMPGVYSYSWTTKNDKGEEIVAGVENTYTLNQANALTRPAAPGGLHSTEQTRSRIVMQWNPVNGVHPVAYYTLYRDGNMVGQTVGTTLEDCGLTAATCYHYQVTATDSHGATSSFSDPVDVITSKDIRARYVLIRRTPANNVNTYMGFTELEVFSEGVNRALGAPVYSSTGTWYSGQGGENLVDGNKFRVPASTSGYVSGDCWFLADLGAEYEVDKIMLYGRSNSPDAPNRERDMAIFALPATALPAGSATTAAAMPGYDALRSMPGVYSYSWTTKNDKGEEIVAGVENTYTLNQANALTRPAAPGRLHSTEQAHNFAVLK